MIPIKIKCASCGKEIMMQIKTPLCRNCKITESEVKRLHQGEYSAGW